MPIASVSRLVEVLEQYQLLPPPEFAEVARHLQERFPDPHGLAKELVQRGWLTPFQVNVLFQGRERELTLGQYVLLERLGQGGMGQVFKARHRRLDRIDALKIIRPEFLVNTRTVQRFHQEARAAARLSHPNIVTIYDADEVGGVHYLAMEYVDGIDLSKQVRLHGTLPIGSACAYVRQAALGLQHAHERGLVHRDIKPSNLMLAKIHGPPSVGLVKILDLGLARLARLVSEEIEAGEMTEPAEGLTASGSIVGTPDYIAPEQARSAHAVDIRADIYSLGCTLYKLLAGKVPFPGGTLAEKLLKHQLDEAPPLEQLRADVPPALAAVVHRMMAKKPEQRFAIPAEVAQALGPFTLLQSVSAEDEEMITACLPPHALPMAMPVATDAEMQLPTAEAQPLGTTLSEAIAPLPQTSQPNSGSTERLPPGSADFRQAGAVPKQSQVVASQRWKWALLGLAAATPCLLTPVVALVVIFSTGAGPPPTRSAAGPVLLPTTKTNPQALGLLDRLDRARIPAAERAVGLPPEVVAVFGSHRGQHWGPVRCLAVSPDGKRVASGGDDRVVRIWDAVNGEELAVCKDHFGPVDAVAFAADGQTLVSGCSLNGLIANRGAIKVWDAANGKRLEVLTESASGLAGTRLDRDGTVIAWYEDGELRRQLRKGGEQTRIPLQLPSPVRCVAADITGARWALGLDNGTVRVIDGQTGKTIADLSAVQLPACTQCAFAPDGKSLATVSSDDTARVWDIAARKAGPPIKDATAVAFSPDGKLLALGHDKGFVRLWDIANQQDKAVLAGHGLRVTCLAFVDAQTLVSGSEDRTVRIWDLTTNTEKAPRKVHAGPIATLVFTPDARRLISGGTDYVVKVWDVLEGQKSLELRVHDGWINALAVSADGRWLASASGDQTLRLWQLPAVEAIDTLRGHTSYVSSADFAPDGKTLASGSWDGTVRLWDVTAARERSHLQNPTKVNALACAPDNKTVAYACGDAIGQPCAIKLWDTHANRSQELKGHKTLVTGLRYAPDGKTLASASAAVTNTPGEIKLWNLATGNERLTFQGHAHWVAALAYAPDGRLIVSSGLDGKLILWDPANGAQRQSWQLPGPIYAVAYAADNRHFATANADGTIYVFRIGTAAQP